MPPQMPPLEDEMPEENPTEAILEGILLNQDENANEQRVISEAQLQEQANTTEAVQGLEPALDQIVLNTVPKEVQKIQIVPTEDENELATTFYQMLRGKPGKTPVKGEDYYTEEEKNELVEEIVPRVTPVLGKDYFTPEEKESFAREILEDATPVKGIDYIDGEDGYTPIKGVDYFDGEPGKDAEVDVESIVSRVTAVLPPVPTAAEIAKKVKKPKDGSPDSPKDIVSKLSSLEGADRLSLSSLKDTEFLRSGAASRDYDLTELKDVAITSPTNSQVLKYNSTTRKWENTTDTVGTGDVVGPASSTDNAIVRYDGTTGKLIQNYTSGAPTISDTGAVSIPLTTGNSLVVDTDVLVVDATNNRVGINTASPTVAHDVVGQVRQYFNGVMIADTPLENATFHGFEVRNVGLSVASLAANTTGEVRIGAVRASYYPTFYSSNAEAMRISTTGNVGINNTNPTRKLDVTGTFAVSGSSFFTGGDIFHNGGNHFFYTTGGKMVIYNDRILGFGGAAGTQSISTGWNSSDSTYRISSGTDLTTTPWVTVKSGSVGIGTVSPATLFDVNGVSTFRDTIFLSTQGLLTFSSDLGNGEGGTILGAVASKGVLVRGGATGTGIFVKSDNRVGIGTTAPSALLTLGTAGSTAGTLSLAGGTSGVITLQTAAAAGTYTLTLPTSDGAANEFLQTDGLGVLTWAAPAVANLSGLGTGVATALAVNIGSAGAPVLFNGAGGTPSSLTLTNATGLPVAGLVSDTTTALGVGSLELGHATDTTLSRSAAGQLAVEGVQVLTASNTVTVSGKTSVQRINAATDGATVTFDFSLGNIQTVTLGGNRTIAFSNTTAGQCVMIELKQDATGTRTVTWPAGISWAGGVAPTLTTTINKTDAIGIRVVTAGSAYIGYVVGANI